MNDTHVLVPVTLLVERDVSWLVELADEEEVWVPKSLIEDCSEAEPREGQEVEIEVPVWFATKEGMI